MSRVELDFLVYMPNGVHVSLLHQTTEENRKHREKVVCGCQIVLLAMTLT